MLEYYDSDASQKFAINIIIKLLGNSGEKFYGSFICIISTLIDIFIHSYKIQSSPKYRCNYLFYHTI